MKENLKIINKFTLSDDIWHIKHKEKKKKITFFLNIDIVLWHARLGHYNNKDIENFIIEHTNKPLEFTPYSCSR